MSGLCLYFDLIAGVTKFGKLNKLCAPLNLRAGLGLFQALSVFSAAVGARLLHLNYHFGDIIDFLLSMNQHH
jgi:hypothetical protein